MHNASIATLPMSFGIMRGAASIARAGRLCWFPFSLTETERLDLVAFMETLTGDDAGSRPSR